MSVCEFDNFSCWYSNDSVHEHLVETDDRRHNIILWTIVQEVRFYKNRKLAILLASDFGESSTLAFI